jgi:hypothetical protein
VSRLSWAHEDQPASPIELLRSEMAFAPRSSDRVTFSWAENGIRGRGCPLRPGHRMRESSQNGFVRSRPRGFAYRVLALENKPVNPRL